MFATTVTTVAVVDDHAIVRQGLKTLLNRDDMTVIGEADSGPEAVLLARELQPDVMLLDIRMKGGDGLQVLPQILSVSPQTKVIMLTTYANPGYLARSINDGAVAYLSKDIDPHKVIQAVRAVAAGEELIDRELLKTALATAIDQSIPEAEPTTLPVDELSEREIEVLKLVAAGLSNAMIAETLSISLTTVKTHVSHILEKLSVTDRTQAALWAVRNNLNL